MENSANKHLTTAVIDKLELLNSQNLDFSSELSDLISELSQSPASVILKEIYEKFDILQENWEGFCREMNKTIVHHHYNYSFASKRQKILKSQFRRVRTLNEQVRTKEISLLNSENELSSTLQKVHKMWMKNIDDLERWTEFDNNRKKELRKKIKQKIQKLEKELDFTINQENHPVPNLNLKIVSKRSPTKSSARSISSNRGDEDIISNRSAFSIGENKGDFSHRSSSSRPKFQKKKILPPLHSQNASEESIFDQIIEEIAKKQENAENSVEVSMRNSSNWNGSEDSRYEVSPEDIKYAIDVLKKANLFNQKSQSILTKISDLLKDTQHPEKLELLYQIIELESKKKLLSSRSKNNKNPSGKPPTPKHVSSSNRRVMIFHTAGEASNEFSCTTPKSGLIFNIDQDLAHTMLSPENQSSSRAQSKGLNDNSLQRILNESWKNTRHVQLEDLINAENCSQGGAFLFNENEMIEGCSPGYKPDSVKKIPSNKNLQINTNEKEFTGSFSPSDMTSPASGMKIPTPIRKQISAEYHSTGIGSTKDTSGLKFKMALKTGENSQHLLASDSNNLTKP
ncbi:unnamed protein product [Blepharisma stoltei]|uniref:Uncharacterized protein n=1 Tax=Blepharisma stoltei TaxID=1481888 RepID=A0AAU9K0N7_9CILI|nr:unnamed protein product [Blepharisma stoltei]